MRLNPVQFGGLIMVGSVPIFIPNPPINSGYSRSSRPSLPSVLKKTLSGSDKTYRDVLSQLQILSAAQAEKEMPAELTRQRDEAFSTWQRLHEDPFCRAYEEKHDALLAARSQLERADNWKAVDSYAFAKGRGGIRLWWHNHFNKPGKEGYEVYQKAHQELVDHLDAMPAVVKELKDAAAEKMRLGNAHVSFPKVVPLADLQVALGDVDADAINTALRRLQHYHVLKTMETWDGQPGVMPDPRKIQRALGQNV